eukprot:537666_1
MESCWYQTLRCLGCLSFTHSIFPFYINIYDINEREQFIHALVSHKELFKAMRFYCNLYYATTTEPIPSEIFDLIELIHGTEEKTDQEKQIILTYYWDELLTKHHKYIYFAPVIFGYVEVICILAINALILSVIFANFNNINTFMNYLFNLSLILFITFSFHVFGIVYIFRKQIHNYELTKILRSTKDNFVKPSKRSGNEVNERFIVIQKWYNLLLLTYDNKYKQKYFWNLLFQKYIYGLFTAVGILLICMFKDQMNFLTINFSTKVEKLYLIFQLIIFPLWYILMVVGIRKFKCCLTLFSSMYIISMTILSIYYYDFGFLKQWKFIPYLNKNKNWVKWLVIANLVLNVLLILTMLCGKRYYYRQHKKYMVSILLIYLTITLKMFFVYYSLSNIQWILTIVLYVLILLSNFIYFSIIHMVYYIKNGFSFGKRDEIKYTFAALLCCDCCAPNFNPSDTMFEEDIELMLWSEDIEFNDMYSYNAYI